ncbi:DUF6153 family protein [Couchioplanes caeruleus]|uniref:Uncharacterized protein n=1 Tax=Couchioplanes caeruleus subsp. caeruleus TaxID=56427 RepID=A0A1K0G1K4_9ACTN|nr:DUF6153 family protein [Couchioplanes caeruleus]OJF11186.1 hypothetical protein BG844_28185 [Couchioplanes caeruleus subsp. caeruleus]
MTTAESASLGHAVRWAVLLCTLFGLATMHTLGHASMPMDSHDHSVVESSAGHSATGESFVGVHEKAVAGPCPDGHCGGQHGAMAGWSICLAILGGLAIAGLFAALLLARPKSRARGPSRVVTSSRASRAPPWRGQGLRVASLAVLRI